MKVACLLTDSTLILAVFDSGGKGKDVFGSGFTGMGEGAGGTRLLGLDLRGEAVSPKSLSKLRLGSPKPLLGLRLASALLLAGSFWPPLSLRQI